tara:strand:- start:229 stop:993 length:765 start_codon:yes stop_codon:yes gene_type:complete
MAEYGKVQFDEGSAGEPKADTAMEEALAAETPEAPPEPEGLEIQPLDNISEKFGGDFNKLAEAYSELEKKFHDKPEAPAEAPRAGLEELQPYVDEFTATGELSPKSRAALAEKFPEELIDDYLQKSAAASEFETLKQQQELNSIYSSVGGEENYNRMVTWAADNLPAEDIAAFNDAVNADLAQANLAVKGLAALYTQSTGSSPQLLQSRPEGSSGPAPYESLAQVMADMKTQEYKTDPAFRKKVEARLNVSNVM